MKEVLKLKIPFSTKHFTKGQLVFVKKMTGAQACLCRGKFRKMGCWVSAWFKWSDKTMYLVKLKKITISNYNFNKIMGEK